jgi:hypothetical protein
LRRGHGCCYRSGDAQSHDYANSETPNIGNIGGFYTGLPRNDNLDLSPRIGFSYDLLGNGRVILRRGYGLTSARRLKTFRSS